MSELAQISAVVPKQEGSLLSADQRESKVRMVAAWMLILSNVLGMLGASWDIQWHAAVGPDSFFTPSHGMLYFSRVIAGFAALWVVISTTIKYRNQVPGVSDLTTTPWLGFLRAPVGFIVAGLGVLSFIAGGLYDLWWHTIYGFDVTLLSPSHFALAFGTIVVTTGMAYAFASEANRESARGDARRFLGFSWADFGVAFSGAALISELGTFTQPGLHEAIFAGNVLVYPIAISLVICLGLFMVASFLRRPGAATLTALLLTGIRTLGYYWAPLMVEFERRLSGLPYKPHPFKEPVVALTLPASLILTGLAVDLVLYLGRKWNAKAACAVAAVVAVAVNHITDPRLNAWVELTQTVEKAEILNRISAATLPSLAVAAVVAILSAWFAWGFGHILRHTDK